MKLRILCPLSTKLQLPPGDQPPRPLWTPHSQTVLPKIQNGMMTTMHKMSVRNLRGGEGRRTAPPIFDDSRGEMSHSGEFKIGRSMESLVEIVQIENSLRNYVNFTLGNGFSWAFETLKPELLGALPPGPVVPR